MKLNEETQMELHERILKYRARLKISQEAAARKADVSMNTWSRWERGESKPEYASLEKIARALQITIGELVN